MATPREETQSFDHGDAPMSTERTDTPLQDSVTLAINGLPSLSTSKSRKSLIPDTSVITNMFRTGECLVNSLSHQDDSNSEDVVGLLAEMSNPAHQFDDEAVEEDIIDDNLQSDDEWVDSDEHEEGEGGNEKINKRTAEQFVQWLRELNDYIIKKQNVEPLPVPEGMLLPPYPRQLRAAAAMRLAAEGPFKGMLLACDMGSGKTVSLLLGIKDSLRPGSGPGVYVTLASCTMQVMRTIKKFFGSTMKALLLNDRTNHPQELFLYDIIVVSYQFLAAEWKAEIRFLRQMHNLAEKLQKIDQEIKDLGPGQEKKKAELIKAKTKDHPQRPRTTLLSELFMQPGVKSFGPKIVLDEVHTIKNPFGLTHKAMREVAKQFKSVDMATGTPMNNSWLDMCAIFAFLSDINISTQHEMRVYFTSLEANQYTKRPEHHYQPRSEKDLNRIRQLIEAVSIRRPNPNSQIQVERRLVCWTMSKDDLELSNKHFENFWRIMKAKKKDGASGDGGAARSANPLGPKAQKELGRSSAISPGWRSLILAQQVASHPQLPDLYELVALAQKTQVGGAADGAADIVQSEEHQLQLDTFMESMSTGDAYRSSKVDHVISFLYRLRDVHPDDAMLLYDDNIYFLDILMIGLSKQEFPIRCELYSGRLDTVKRDSLLTAFAAEKGFRVLLCTPGVAREGLDLQWANIVFRLGPWWKRQDEDHALGRVKRDGQHKIVYDFEMRATGSRLERYKAGRREKKNNVIKRIVPEIERLDDFRFEEGTLVRQVW